MAHVLWPEATAQIWAHIERGMNKHRVSSRRQWRADIVGITTKYVV